MAGAGPAIAPAVIAAMSGFAGVAVGGFITWKVTTRSVESNERLARERQQHEVQLARENRVYEGTARAYEALLREVSRATTVVRRTRSLVGTSAPVPEAPSDNEMFGLDGLVFAFGSDQVRDLIEEWREGVRGFQFLAQQLDILERRPMQDADWQRQWDSYSDRLHEYRSKVLEDGERLIAQTNAEVRPLDAASGRGLG